MHTPALRLVLTISLALFGSITQAGDPFRIESKPPTLGYITNSTEPVEEDLLDVPMVSQLAMVMGTVAPRSFSTLRRAISRDPVDAQALADAPVIGVLHLERTIDSVDYHIALRIYELSSDALALQSVDDPTQTWSITRLSFDRLGIRWVSADVDNREPLSGRFVLPKPYAQSSTVLDLRTIRARIKHSYPRLTRTLDEELFRVRLPKNYNPDFPAGVLVWISPMPDGRIPTIFEPIADRLGLIVVGVDNNGNKRETTDRLQNHLDSIESVAAAFRIDRKRIYLTGMSGGGRCTGILQLSFPELFAGAVPIVGLDTYHKAPTGEPNRFWPARLGKPAGKWMRLLKDRRIAGITGTTDFNQPEMSIRQGLLKRDGIDMRLDIIPGMAHTMPTAEQFSDALDWVDGPRRTTMVEEFKEAKDKLAGYLEEFGDTSPATPAGRKSLIEIITLAPWTEPAAHACRLLGYE